MIYPEKILRLQHMEGFIEAYYENLSKYKNKEKAYMETDKEHIAHFGHWKYTCYDSFRASMSRFINLKHKKK